MLAKVLTSMGSLFTKAGKAITPKTLVEKGKDIGIDIDKLKLGDKKLVNKVLKELGFKKKSTVGGALVKGGAAAGAGSAATLGAQKFTGDVKEELERSRMAGGGMVKKRAKTRTKVSRGTGAAIRGKKFKGVF
jgi:ribosomal protein L12E/L44/L45/RPP1/RPP2